MAKITPHITGWLLIWLILLASKQLQAKQWHVGANKPYTSISSAIHQASPGDTIFVHPGSYHEESIRISKSLNLIGIDLPIIDGQYQVEPILIQADSVLIQGFDIRNSGRSSLKDIAAIKIHDSRWIRILENTLSDNFFGIYMQNCRVCQVSDNQINSVGENERLVGNGIHAWKSDSLEISNNQVSGHRDGIYFEFVSHSRIYSNQSQNNLRYGLHFMFSHDNNYQWNSFQANGAGVAVMYSQRVHMENNNFASNWGDAAYGLLLKDISDSFILGNTFTKNTTAIFMEGSSRTAIKRNRFENNGWAIRLFSSCQNSVFQENNFIQNSFDVASNGGRMTNKFSQNYWDKYEGYDINKDGLGDIPHHPVSLFSMLLERYPMAMLLFRSFMAGLFDRSEKLIPSLTPGDLLDTEPRIKPIELDNSPKNLQAMYSSFTFSVRRG